MTKRVLGIVGSPRKDGNTEILVDEILAGALESGAEVEKVRLQGLKISPCRACDVCREKRKCVIEDDMVELVAKMKTHDVWVLGTPIYWWGPTAQLKAFIDRWYGIRENTFQGKSVVLAVPLGGGSERYARHTVGMMEDVFSYLGMNHVATVLAPGVNNKGAIRERQYIMQEAYQAGLDSITPTSI